ncbi:site-specific DNA-methyltransferase [Staphylococcus epidermidis]|uniref:DNA methyltransferase n=1 Tax=Staphylococcus TaxID=1279 RepID=UPI0011A5B775|nr:MULTISPECIES: site-specific DNA-methyltransferase [Staphylococcus]MBE2144208.1 site-specific DNA-methyltransferase [Staphylococcus argenteus]MCG1568011.1 site-specific DNA-methyltransferase [Staphylococcus epidermidis]MDK8129432.1 site-specific DNA-methyltransferase [Staphylococcus epidermidis]HCZ8933364.1 site-specific DNA-methyltransferase [Staphylococcus aureus]
MSTNILDEISKVLNGIEKYWINNKLAKQIIIEGLRNNDNNLISKLLSNQTINEAYVQDIDGYKIFDKEAFISMLRYKNYWQDSYTKYANKIGLTTEGKYLNYNSDVVLDFPFKDCVLEGSMTKENSILKNDERFYNQRIAKEEIDTLLSSKALTNIKKYDRYGENAVSQLNKNDNLIIKGNNLIALHNLKCNFKDKIKLIFIDPPYNTGSDSFKYNDKFNHSSWLTFIKNRLEIARELLSYDGVILVQCDHHELGYLNVLMDDIFGSENKVQVISCKTSAPAGFKTVNPGPIDVTEYILYYAKDKSKVDFKKGYVPVSYDSNYNRYIENYDQESNKWIIKPIVEKYYEVENINDNKHAKEVWGSEWKVVRDKGIEKFALENAERIVSIRDPHNPTEKLKNLLKESKNTDKVIEVKRDIGSLYLYNGGSLAFYKNKLKEIDGRLTPTELLTDLWTDISWAGIANEGKVKLKNGKKPEKLLKRIIELTTNEKDIVLDFFMGSATTQAVAHKLNRQYIGIEQMEYINSISVPRLQNVIGGEQSGISKSIGWQGGGSFVYVELAKQNQEIIDRIINSNTKEELNEQIDDLLSKGVLNYEVDFNEFTNTKKEFNELKLEEQKEVLIRVLDSNQLYVNYSDIEDTAYNFKEDEIAFNHSFYGGE